MVRSAALLLAAACLSPAAAAGSGPVVAEGRVFRVLCHFDDPRSAGEALAAAERVWPLAAAFYGLDPKAGLEPRLEIHLFRDLAAYAQAEAPLTGGRFRNTGAFTAYTTRAAYVAVQPACSDALLARFGLPFLTRILVAHEACHVVCYRATRNFAGHPPWYAEGFATWAASRALADGEDGVGAGADPFTARLMARAQHLQAAGQLPDAERILTGGMGLGFHDQYAVHWALFRFLMEGARRGALGRLAATVHAAPEGAAVADALRAGVEAWPGGLKRLEEEFRAALATWTPYWDEELRSLERTDGGWLQRAFPNTPAVAWSVAAPPSDAWTFDATVELFASLAPSVEVRLDRDAGSFLALELIAGRGVRLSREDLATRRRATLAEAERPGDILPGVPVRVQVAAAGGRLQVRLRGAPVLDVPLEGRTGRGRWGLAVTPGAAALWRLARVPGAAPPARAAGPEKPAQLAARIRHAPDGAEAFSAVEGLARLGSAGLRALANVIRDEARRHPALARAAALRLGEEDADERIALLRRAYRRDHPGPVRGAVLLALARRYPADAAWVHAALADPSVPDRGEILALLAGADVPEAVLRKALAAPETAPAAYAALMARDLSVTVEELAGAARAAARLGFSGDYARAVEARLAAGRDWELLHAVARLVNDADPLVRDGARTLLMTVSGKDIAPDADLWASWIAARRDRYELPDAVSPGRVGAAVLRGVAYLRARLLATGECTYDGEEWTSTRRDDTAAATGLAILALRASGVPKDDPAIRRAVEETLLDCDVHGMLRLNEEVARYNYAASIVTMALAALDPERFRYKIQTLANRISAGQLESGQWTYATGTEYGKRPPASSPMYRFIGDASNTQYALLGLRAARVAGAEIRSDVWARALTNYLESQDPWGGWGYGILPWSGVERSMTPAGLAGVVICLEGLHGAGAPEAIAASRAVQRGRIRQGQLLLRWGYEGFDHYAFYGVERACVLAGVRLFNDYDWYRAGALDLLARQRPDGSWYGRSGGQAHQTFDYGADIDTAYALLFLKRATTPVAGTRADGVVRCPPGPPYVRAAFPGHWWPMLPSREKKDPKGAPGTLPE